MVSREISQADYLALVVKLLQQSGAKAIQAQTDNFAVAFDLGAQARIKLAQLYARHKHLADAEMRRALRKLFAEHQARLTQANPQLQQIKALLRPVIRDKRYFSLSQLRLRSQGVSDQTSAKFPLRPFAGEFVQALYLDSPDYASLVTQSQLDEWQLSFEQAWLIALDNLRGVSKQGLREVSPGLYCSTWQDAYDTARCVLPEILQGVKLMGDPVFAFPTRHHLLVAGADDLSALQAMASYSAELLRHTEPALSAQLLRKTGESWQVFQIHGVSGELLRFEQMKLLAGDYEQQKGLLKTLLQQQGQAISVAAYQTFRSQAGQGLLSMAQVTNNVATLLPEADKFVFFDTPSQESLMVDWAYAQQVFGSALQKQALYPKRYLLQGQASPKQIALLRHAAEVISL